MTTEVVVVTTTNTVVTENTETNVVEVTASGTTPTVDIIAEGPAGPPGGQVTVQDEGITVGTLDDKLNFVGSMVGVTNNPATETITVTVTAPSPTVTLTGAVTGSGTMTNLGNVSIATTATADPTLTLAGDATGTATFTNLGDATLTVTVVDDSHNHIISNVDGLQDALDSKLPSADYTAADVLTKIKTVDGAGSGLDADLLDGQSGSYYNDFTNATNKPDPTITLSGDATGSVTLTDLASGTLSVTVVDDSHNHVISNVDGLQDALDAKLASADYTAADVLTKIKTVDGAGSGLDADLLDGQSSAYYTAINDRLGYTAENAANKGVANGYASLDGAGLVPSTQLPSYVDDVLEYANVAAFPATGVSGVIYVAIDTSKTYRWTGSVYVEISASPGTTDSLTEGTVNLYFTTARARESLSAGTGISYNSSTGVITNSAPDQTVALTAGTGISTSGTYPNFTITNSAPDQTVALTGSGTTSITGTYPNFTISSADQYVGTVTSVALSGGTTGLTVTGSPITSSGTITIGGTLAVANGGTGATNATDARTNLGLGTAATTDASAYATAAQGAKADTAVQTIGSADGSVTITGTTAIDLSVAVAGSTSNVLLPVRNTTGATLTKGTAVYISGATGQISTVSKAIATSDATSAQTLGLVTANISNNSNGNVTLIGTITNMDTSAYSDGQQLYLSPATAGTLTATKPYAPNHLVYMAVVEHAHPTHGKLFVKVQNGYEMDELHDVSAQSPTNGQTIVYNSTSGLWEKNTVSLTAGVNGTLPVANGGTGQTSFTDGQLLIGNSTGNTLTKAALTAGTNVSITNGSGSITINATDQYVGTVTSVAALTLGTTGTDLSSSVANGTTTPVITLNVPTASASNRGALSSTDWSTFNGKQAALVSGSNIKTVNGTTLLGSGDLGTIGVAYGGTGATSLTSGYLLKGNGTSAVSASVVYDNGTQVGIGTTSPTSFVDIYAATGANLNVRGDGGVNISGIRSSTDTSGPNLVLRKSRGTSASPTAVATGDNMGTLVFSAFGGTNNRNIATIASNVEYYVSDSILSSNLTFSTTSTSTTPTEVMRIDSSGNVGIATASPGAKLDIVAQNAIRGTGFQPFLTLRDSSDSNKGSRIQTASAITIFYNDTTGGGTYTERMRIDASGNVGIGTSSPAQRIHAATTAAPSGTTQSFLRLTGDATYGADFGGGIIQGVGPIATISTVNAGTATERMRIDSSGNVGIGTTGPGALLQLNKASGAADLRFSVAGTLYGNMYASSSDMDIFAVAAIPLILGTNNTERMRITSAGDVGIGTSSPGFKLDVSGDAHTSGSVFTGSNTDGWGRFVNSGGALYIQAGSLNSGSATAQPIIFTNMYGGSERMRITAAGNVGIGTNNPVNRFEVVGPSGGDSIMINRASNAAYFQLLGASYPTYNAIQSLDGSGNEYWGIGGYGTSNTMVFRTNSGSEKMRIGNTGIVYINTTSTPTFGSPKLIVDGGISGKGTVTINSSTATTIAEGAGMLLLIRNNTHGGTAVVQYENAVAPIIIATSGGTTFQTGTPSGSAQIQLINKSGNLGVAALASGDRNGASLSVTILQAFT